MGSVNAAAAFVAVAAGLIHLEGDGAAVMGLLSTDGDTPALNSHCIHFFFSVSRPVVDTRERRTPWHLIEAWHDALSRQQFRNGDADLGAEYQTFRGETALIIDRGRIGTGAAGYKCSGGMQTIHIGAGRDGVTQIDTRSEAALTDRLHVGVHAEGLSALHAAGKSGD